MRVEGLGVDSSDIWSFDFRRKPSRKRQRTEQAVAPPPPPTEKASACQDANVLSPSIALNLRP